MTLEGKPTIPDLLLLLIGFSGRGTTVGHGCTGEKLGAGRRSARGVGAPEASVVGVVLPKKPPPLDALARAMEKVLVSRNEASR